MARDVNDVALSNSPALRERADDLAGRDPAVREFRAWAARTDAATTVNAHKLVAFGDVGEVLSGRGIIARSHPGWSDGQIETEFHRLQDDREDGGRDWYPARNAFERHWQHGTQFVSFTLVGPGSGLAGSKFGDFALVVDPLDPAPDALAVFPGDTAQRYAPGGVLEVARCEREAATWADRGDLLTIKHAADVAANPYGPWGEVVCDPRTGDYSEAVRAGQLPVSKVTEIRLSAELYEEIKKLSTEEGGARLTTDERVKRRAGRLFARWQASFGVSIVGT
jgi:hypothetical protein